MEIIKSTINDKEYQFICESRSTRSGFAHDVTMFVNGSLRAKNSAFYLNRTWECWRYQSAVLGALYNAKKEQLDIMKQNFMYMAGIKRMTAKRRAQFEEIAKNDPYIQELDAMRDRVKELTPYNGII